MSLAIAIDRVADVLLPDGWHKVADRSFDLDAYEYRESADESGQEDVWLVRGGVVAGVPSTGATWTEPDGRKIFCPLTAILAVRYAAIEKKQAIPKPMAPRQHSARKPGPYS
jgi:hypothetical protein